MDMLRTSMLTCRSSQPTQVVQLHITMYQFKCLCLFEGAFDVDSAADTVCNLLQCTNTDIVSAVLRHISECEVSISTLFTERALCTIQVSINCANVGEKCAYCKLALTASSSSFPPCCVPYWQFRLAW